MVYEIKCVIELLLDTVENFADSLLNALAPLLQGVDGQYGGLLCGPLVETLQPTQSAGICL